MNVKYYFLLNSKTNKKGQKFIKIVLRINKTRFEFSTGIFVQPKYWLQDKARVKSSDPESYIKNKKLQLLKTRLEELSFELMVNNKSLTKEWLHNFIFGYNKNNITFREFALDYLEKSSLSYNTKRRYKTAVNRFSEYANNIKLTEITQGLVEKYIDYAKKQGLHKNTYYKDVSIVKMFLNRAIKEGYLNDNPAKEVKVKRFPGHREFLTADELEKLVELYFNGFLNRSHRNILRYFLFSCFTGLRYSDIKELKGKHIKKVLYDGQEKYFVEKTQHKTDDFVEIPLPEVAIKLLPEYLYPEIPVFDVKTNQVTNRELKKIMQVAEIDKNISFHSARHTYATLLLNKGVDISVVSKLVGHRDLATTRIYAKVLKDSLIQAVDSIDMKVDE